MPKDVIDPARDLRVAIDQLSPRTRLAMLEAVRCPATRLIAGAYVASDREGICPLLASHRRGGRVHDASTTSSPFAAAWDRFTQTRTGATRDIGAHERRMLETMLLASLARDRRRRVAAELARAKRGRRAERERIVRAAVAGVRRGLDSTLREGLVARALERDRAPELKDRAGWRWVGMHRRYDDYRVAVGKALRTENAGDTGSEGSEAAVELVA
jgi:hypothetical protein